MPTTKKFPRYLRKPVLKETASHQPVTTGNISEQTQPKYQQLLQIQSQQFTQLHQQQKSIAPPSNFQLGKSVSATIAQDLLSDVRSIVLDIGQNYQHQRFAPGRLASLKRQVEMAEANLKVGLMEAVMIF